MRPGASLAEAARALESLLVEAGVDSPGADARALLGEALGMSPGELALARVRGRELADPEREQLMRMAARRAAREPLQHILGRAPFRRLELRVGPGCLVPRPETELLVDLVAAHLDRRRAAGERGPFSVLDLGTGSGAIAAALATERDDVRVTALDVSPEALHWARINLEGLNRGGLGVELVEADATVGRPEFERAFDVVVSNPPYVPESERPEQPEALADPERALYGGSPDGLRIPVLMAERAAEWCRPGGLVAFEHAETQGRPLRDRFEELGFEGVRTDRDLAGRDRMTSGVMASSERMDP
ncbi:peptide chain release factor N(5)-glutamine methyltransferase [Arthrobacter sp. UM1]|nr:peptide chain release factor N(5)-glutamine methyltransferase [Arthrobacter sp. UM1]